MFIVIVSIRSRQCCFWNHSRQIWKKENADFLYILPICVRNSLSLVALVLGFYSVQILLSNCQWWHYDNLLCDVYGNCGRCLENYRANSLPNTVWYWKFDNGGFGISLKRLERTSAYYVWT